MALRLSWLILTLLALPAFAAGKKKKSPPPPPPPLTAPTAKVSESLSDTALGAITSATKAQVFRVSDSGGLRPDPAKAIAADFVRGVAGKELDARQFETLRSVLYDDKSFRFEQDVSKCNFVPHLSFQLQAGIDTLEALVSFKCDQVLFVIGKPGNRWVPQGRFNVKPARKKLLELAKAALPTDAETQNLK